MVVQCDGMSFLDYKKKHQTLPDTSRNSHKYQEYQLRERGLQRDESFSVNDDCLEVINYKAEQRYEQQICIIYLIQGADITMYFSVKVQIDPEIVKCQVGGVTLNIQPFLFLPPRQLSKYIFSWRNNTVRPLI